MGQLLLMNSGLNPEELFFSSYINIMNSKIQIVNKPRAVIAPTHKDSHGCCEQMKRIQM